MGVCRQSAVMAHRPWRERSLPDAGDTGEMFAWRQWGWYSWAPLLLGAGGGWALAKPKRLRRWVLGRLPGHLRTGAQTRAEDACTASSQTPLPECPLTQQSLRSERHAGAVDGAVLH